MSNITNIFHLYQNMDDYNETNVYGKLNESINWGIFAQYAEGKAEYTPLALKLRTNKILKKDFIDSPGGNGLVSKRALEIIGLETFHDFVMFPLTINDVSYFALYATKNLDCIDAANSKYTDLLYTHGFWEIDKHAFHLDKIKDNTVFALPQTGRFLYCTQDVGRRILENELNMVALPLLKVEEDLRQNRVVYDNPVLGIRLEEPKNWVMDFPQLTTLKVGKKMEKRLGKPKFPTIKAIYPYLKCVVLSC